MKRARKIRKTDIGSIGFAALGRSILKNNRAQRPDLKRRVSIVNLKKSYPDPKKASPELLYKIRTEMQLKQRSRNKKMIYISSFIFIIIAIGLWLLN